MFKYIDICVDMKQGRKCKDALINYRNACQQVNVGSLEEVIKYLLQVASQRAEEASKAAEAKLDAVEDLEAEASPEEMMLSYVSGEKTKDRMDRELVTPWFKFLWESYRWGPDA
jgi:translation initiation factor 3 subunit A